MIYQPGKRSGSMVLSAHAGLSGDAVQAYGRVKVGRFSCIKTLEPQEIKHQALCEEYPFQNDNRDTPHGCYGIPLVFGETALGLMSVWTPVGYRRDSEDEAWLRTAAPLIAGMIKRKQQEDEPRRTKVQLIE